MSSPPENRRPRPDPRSHPNARYEPTEKDLRTAYHMWVHSAFGVRDIDQEIEAFLGENHKAPSAGQLEQARAALQKTTTAAARNLKITRQSYSKLEQGEREGTITLTRLKAAAEAIDCELVYVIRPASRQSFARVVFETILPFARESAWVLTRRKEDKAKALQAVAGQLLRQGKFRRDRGWSERTS